jgi:NAD-dependent dihydropyrimidine dehydrogenase PreA subunit
MYVPKIDAEKCDACGECVDVCPADVMISDGTTATVTEPDQCLGCESCVSVCDKEAISVEEV